MIRDMLAKLFGEDAAAHVSDGLMSVFIIVAVVVILWMIYRAMMGSRRKK